MDLFQCARTHRYAVELSVMANDGLLGAGATNVKLKAINAMFQREIESRDGVFRRVKPGAAMSEQ